MKLLIVDDSNLMRRAIARTFDREHDIATASDGVEALRVAETFVPDIVTMDLSMPNMDGLTCIEGLLRRCPAARILVVSALKDKPTAVEAIKRGAHGFLIKPFTAETLSMEIGDMLD